MIRISLPYLWTLTDNLEEIGRLDHAKDWYKIDLMIQLYSARSALEGLLQGSVFSPTLRSSRPLAKRLLSNIEAFTSSKEDEDAEKVHGFQVSSLVQLYAQFRIAFLAALATFPAYFVSQKGSHDTLSLLDQPKLMFPAELEDKVPEAMFDVAEAGKALCYELPTACGFHLFRATESVLRRYYVHVTGGKAHPKVRNIMVYVTAMRHAGHGDEKILSVIQQLSKLHRNPIAHPEAVLTLDEAISILGLARSAITVMLAVLPVVPKTTTSP